MHTGQAMLSSRRINRITKKKRFAKVTIQIYINESTSPWTLYYIEHGMALIIYYTSVSKIK